MKTKFFLIMLVFLIVLGCTSSSQRLRTPLFFQFQKAESSFADTDFCKKYKCKLVYARVPKGWLYKGKKVASNDPTIVTYALEQHTEGQIIEEFELVGYGKKVTGNPDLDDYTVETIRAPLEKNSKQFWMNSGLIAFPRRYRGAIDPQRKLPDEMYRVINDFTFLAVGKTYPEKTIRTEVAYQKQNIFVQMPKDTDIYNYRQDQLALARAKNIPMMGGFPDYFRSVLFRMIVYGKFGQFSIDVIKNRVLA